MLKKMISVLLAASMLLALSACSMEKISELKLPPLPGKEEAAETEAAPSAETVIPAEPELATPAGSASLADPEVTVQDIPEEQETGADEEAEPEPADGTASEETTETELQNAEETVVPDEQTAEETASGPETQTQPEMVTEPKPEESAPAAQPIAEAAPQAAEEPAVLAQTPAAVPVITISKETKPGDIARYKSVNLYGVIETSHGVITQVYAVIMNSQGEPVQDCAYYPGTQSFDLANTVNYCLRFGRLDAGNYIYQLNVAAQNGDITVSTTLTEAAFCVSAPPQTQTEASSGTESGTETSLDPSQYSAKQTSDGSNAGQIWNCLIARLNNPFAVAGILGNIRAESSCLPYAVENDTGKGLSFSLNYTEEADNGTISRDIFAYSPPGDSLGYGFGLCQWTMDRKGNLYDYAKNNGVSLNSIDTQCGFLMMELETYFPSLLEYLKTCTDAREACRRFCTDYEKAAVWGERTDYAMEYLEKYAKN